MQSELIQCQWCSGFITGDPHEIPRGKEILAFHQPVDLTKSEEEQKRQRCCARNWLEAERRIASAANGTL